MYEEHVKINSLRTIFVQSNESIHGVWMCQQFFSHVRIGLPELNQYLSVVDKVSCSRKQHIDFAGGETLTSNLSIPSLTLYQLNHCTPFMSDSTRCEMCTKK